MTTLSHEKNTKVIITKIPSGNTLPNIWYKKLETEKGRTDITTMVILAEILYQYRSKFKQDLWQTSYDHFTNKFGYHKDTVRRSLVKLEKGKYLSREFHEVIFRGQTYNNVLHIRLLPGITALTSPEVIKGSEVAEELKVAANYVTATYFQNLSDPYPKSVEIDNIDYVKNKSINRSIDLSINEFNNFKRDFCNKEREELAKKRTLEENTNQTDKAKSFGSLTLADFSPLKEELLEEINTKSGKDFSKEFASELLVKLTKKYPNHRFFNTKAFISYMTKVFKNEMKKQENSCQDHTPIPKRLKDFVCLEPELLEDINKLSGRHFTKNFTKKLIEKLAEKYPNHKFYSRQGFISYMAEVFKRELHKEEKVNGSSFTHSKPEESEKFLEEVETSLDTSQVGQMQRRIIGAFDSKRAYDILKNFIFCGLTADNQTYMITITDEEMLNVALIKDQLLEQVRQIYGSQVKTIKFKIVKTCHDKRPYQERDIEEREITDTHPLWLKAKPMLIQAYGEKVYISWFSKLDIHEIKGSHVILKAPTGFIRDWIANNYLDNITACLNYLHSEFKEVTVIAV